MSSVVERRLGAPDLIVLDPARQGAGQPVMERWPHSTRRRGGSPTWPAIRRRSPGI